jgi:HEAT repeat protein
MPDGHTEAQPTIEQLIADLSAGDVLVRRAAAEVLGTRGDRRAVEPLIAALADPEPHVHLTAIEALGNLGDARAVEPLADHPDITSGIDLSTTIEGAIAYALTRMGEPGFIALQQSARDFSESEFPGAVFTLALGEIAEPRATDVLLLALASPVYEVCEAAVRALEARGEPPLPVMVQMLEDEVSKYGYYFARHMLRRKGEQSVPILAKALEASSIVRVRRSAASILGDIGDQRAREPLRSALRDEDDGVRQEAVIALGQLGDLGVLDAVLELLAHEDFAQDALAILVDLGEPALEPLLSMARDKSLDRSLRIKAITALGRLEDARAVELLIALLADDEVGVRASAAQALGGIKDSKAAESLLLAAKDDSLAVRFEALCALAALGDTRIIPSLVRVIGENSGGEVDDRAQRQMRNGIRMRAMFALGGMGAQAVEPLKALLATEDRLTLLQATMVLAQVGPEGKAVLVEAAYDERPFVRGFAIERLCWKPDPELRDLFRAALQDADHRVRSKAAQALGQLGDTGSIEALIDLLQDRCWMVRYYAAWALARVGDDRAIAPLMDAYNECREHPQRNQFARKLDYIDAAVVIQKRLSGQDTYDEHYADGDENS